MKILMLNYEFPPIGGGGGPVTLELAAQLVSLGHQVDVVTMGYRDLPRHEQVRGINLYRTAALRRRADICRTHEMATFLLGAAPFTRKLARHIRHDVIHCHFIFPTGPLAWFVSRMTGIPYLITCHGSDVPGHNPDRFGLAHKLLGPAWRALVRRTPLLTTPSESLRQTLLNACPQAATRVVPNAIHLPPPNTSPREKSILMCSRILRFKGFQYALEAVKSLEAPWQLHVIGDGPYLTELKQQAAGCKMPITFWGWLDRTDSRFQHLYQTSSIFVFPSEAENFPTVLLEAMAAGLAIITTTAGGCPEVVGDTARLVPPRDPSAIRRHLQELMASPALCSELGQAARRRVETHFIWPAVARQYLDCYHTVIKQRTAAP